ncbi:MAG: hypothetical protein FJ202_05835 [Gemmatimonadetes bacterium]|nr:hypothetical protein [Gemmatimonadota bacterium]
MSGGSHLTLGVGHSYGSVDVPGGALRYQLVSTRVAVAMTTRLFVNTLVQVNTLDRNVSANVRLQYIYRPGSDIFLVFSESRGDRDRPWSFEERGIRLKVTWLARL